jgi:hypothetical protein
MFSFQSSDPSRRAARALLAVALLLGVPSSSLAAEGKPKAAVAKTSKPAGKATSADAKAGKARSGQARTTAPRLSVTEIVKRHTAARGGAQAWKSVQALSMSGKIDAGAGDSVARSRAMVRGSSPKDRKAQREAAANAQPDPAAKQVQLPFRLAMQRPNRSRVEIEFAGKTAVQVYDGKNGWKVRPFLNRKEVEPFTDQEAKTEAESADLDGLLIGYQAKGTKVALAGIEKVEGRDAYKLEARTKAGVVRHVWIDAKTFLDVKVEGARRQMDGKLHDVFVYQRDFRTVQGVKVPFVLETVVDGYPQTHKIRFEKVAVNPKLEPAAFAKPKA